MKKINIVNIEDSDIKYNISRFPDGDIRFEITDEELDRKDEYSVICRIRTGEDLYLLSQVCDILNNNGVIFEIVILYLMGARMDRILDFNKPYSLRIIANTINSFNAKNVTIIDVHSKVALELIKKSTTVNFSLDGLKNVDVQNMVFAFPDDGALKRYGGEDPETVKSFLDNIILCEKKRDENGKLIDFKIKHSCNINNRDITLIDDLCDGGGTFVGLSKLLRPLTKGKLILTVTHAVQKSGLENVSNYFDYVIISNSFHDWDKETLPENVLVNKINYETKKEVI